MMIVIVMITDDSGGGVQVCSKFNLKPPTADSKTQCFYNSDLEMVLIPSPSPSPS